MEEVIKLLRSDPRSDTEEMTTDLVEMLSREHRTHQANVIRNLQRILMKYYKRMEPFTDARNEVAVEFAGKVAEIDLNIPYI